MRKTVLLFAMCMLVAQFVFAQDYHWPLKENLNDVVGGRNGTNFGVTFQNDAQRGPVAFFDGTAYAKLPSVINGLTEVTISVWFRMDVVQPWSRIYTFGKGDQTEPKDVLMVIPVNGAAEPVKNWYRFTLSDPNGPWYDIDLDPADVNVSVGTWYLSTVVLKPNTITIYHNDKKVFSEDVFDRPVGTLQDIENALGKSFWPDALWKGALSDLRIYKSALTDQQVAQLYGNATSVAKHFTDNSLVYSRQNQIGIKMTSELAGATVTVTDLTGALVAQMSIEDIQKATFKKGVYLLKIDNNNKVVYTDKLLIKQ